MNGKAPRMSKKHFEFLADVIREYDRELNSYWKLPITHRITEIFARRLQETNSDFDPAKFLASVLPKV